MGFVLNFGFVVIVLLRGTGLAEKSKGFRADGATGSGVRGADQEAQVNRQRNIYYCKRCSSTSGFAEIRMPYAMKLMKQEVGGMSIGMGLISE